MPRTLSAYEGARLTGMTAAQEEHQRLGTTMHERVPVFDVIEDARIWLFFQPMRTLYGAYERHGDAAGIIINSQHPLSLQRFTAGHEYGHHVLGHEASADDEERIYRGDRQSMQEVAAQAFAGEFLMPVQLVNYTLRTMGLAGQRPAMTPSQIYQLTLELGVSYAAVVTQLVGQHKLTIDAGRRLRKLSPLDIKIGLAGVNPPVHGQMSGSSTRLRRAGRSSPACATTSTYGCPRRRRRGTSGISLTRLPACRSDRRPVRDRRRR